MTENNPETIEEQIEKTKTLLYALTREKLEQDTQQEPIIDKALKDRFLNKAFLRHSVFTNLYQFYHITAIKYNPENPQYQEVEGYYELLTIQVQPSNAPVAEPSIRRNNIVKTEYQGSVIMMKSRGSIAENFNAEIPLTVYTAIRDGIQVMNQAVYLQVVEELQKLKLI